MSQANEILQNNESLTQEEQQPAVLVNIRDLAGFVEVMDATPTHTPRNFWDQIKFCADDNNLYVYDYKSHGWHIAVVVSNAVLLTGDQTVAGIKTFSSIPILPSSNPTTDDQAARKKYVDEKFDLLPTFVMTPSSVLRVSADASGNAYTSSQWVKKKDINTNLAGTLRVKFDISSGDINNAAYARVYINGSAVGIQRTIQSNNYTTFEEDFTVSIGDNIQLYVMADDGVARIYWRNFRLYYDKVIGDFGGNPSDYDIIQND